MATLKGYKKVGSPFTNDSETVKVTYDFSVDAGAVGALDVLLAEQNCVITGFYMVVETAATSGGSMTLDVGITGDTNLLLADLAVASMTAGSLHKPTIVEGTPNVLPMPVKLASAAKVLFEIKTATLLTGKMHMYFTVQRY
jgi:hypothetical protein